MRKHYKLISSIVCLILCVCMVTFGVYAARYGLVTLNSTVSFTPTTAKLKIFGGIAGQAGFNNPEIVASQIYYACNYNTEPGTEEGKGNYAKNNSLDVFTTWNYEKIYFAEYKETGTKTHPDPISFYIQITNYVEADVNYTITVNNPSNYFKYSFAYEIADNSLPALNSSTEATDAGWWYIGATKASKPIFHKNSTKPGSNKKDFTGTTTKVVDLSNVVDTTLQTIMMVVTIEVVDADTSIEDDTGFSFTIGANVSTN